MSEELKTAGKVVNAEKPSVGRMVHYVAYGTPGGEFPAGVCRAAVITGVESDVEQVVSLFVMNPSGVFLNTNLYYDADKKPGTWHWPERT